VLVAVLNKQNPTAATLASLTDAEVRKCVFYELDLGLRQTNAVLDSKAAQQRVALKSCAKCACKEAATAQFKTCQQCKVTFYCGKACQKADWKAHKKLCADLLVRG
jgi:hypothetical protein